MKKDWAFESPHGDLRISVSSFLSKPGEGFVSLNISPIVYGSWTVKEEGNSLASVLNALPNAGFDIQRLSFIQLRLEEKDAMQLVAIQAALSKKWRSALNTKSAAQTHPLVVEFINQSGAYEEWNRIFGQKGLKLRAVWVEELALQPFSKSGAKCPAGINCTNLLVPSDAFVQMNITPLSKQ